jgi:ABC-type glycerol-3-phosphate transport system substrate-binding protein
MRKNHSWKMIIVLTLALVLVVPTAAHVNAADTIDCKGAKTGDTLSMNYQWSGQEETRLNQILKPLADACGIVLKPETSRDQSLLDTEVQAGNPPDVAFVANSALVQRYSSKLIALDTLGATKTNYADFFLQPVTFGGKWLGLPVKADIKTIICWLRRGCGIAERVPRPMHLANPVEKQRNCERRLRSRRLITGERST